MRDMEFEDAIKHRWVKVRVSLRRCFCGMFLTLNLSLCFSLCDPFLCILLRLSVYRP